MLRVVTVVMVVLTSYDFFVLDAKYTRASREVVRSVLLWI